MIHLLIVDDEAHWADNLADHKPWEQLGIDIVHKAYSAFEALELANVYPIHLLLTDILMPELNGLELIEEMRKKRPDLLCVLLSGHSEFDYAKQAVQLGAFDYLLKPIKDEELFRVMDRAVRQLIRRKEEHSVQDRLAYTLQENLPLIRGNLLKEILEGKSVPGSRWNERAARYRLPFQEGDRYRLLLVRIEQGIDEDEPSGPDRALLDYAVMNIAGEWLEPHMEVWSGGEEHGYIVLLLKPRREREDSGSDGELLEQLLLGLQQKIRQFLKLTVSLLISPENRFPDNIPGLYRNAISCFRQQIGFEPEMILHMNEAESRTDAKSLHSLLASPSLLQLLEIDSRERAAARLDEIAAELRRHWSESYEHLLAACCEISLAFAHFAHKNGLYLQEIAAESYEKFADGQIRSIAALHEWSRQMLDAIHRETNREAEVSRKGMIDAVQRFVEHNLEKDVSLRTIADHVMMHPTHLSKVYKLETGQNLSEYLLRIRMEKACRLLKDTNMKVYGIAEKIGYLDPAYFIKVFRKCFGMTPQEFRDR